MPKIIDNFRDKYSFLSNFYRISVIYKGHAYKSSEHAFAAAKAVNEKDRQYVADSTTPSIAKRRGREIPYKHDWDNIRVMEMGMIVYCKFSQNKWLHDQLCATGDGILIEGNTWGDNFWGMTRDAQGNWVGENYLGRTLMSVRNIFLDTRLMKGE